MALHTTSDPAVWRAFHAARLRRFARTALVAQQTGDIGRHYGRLARSSTLSAYRDLVAMGESRLADAIIRDPFAPFVSVADRG